MCATMPSRAASAREIFSSTRAGRRTRARGVRVGARAAGAAGDGKQLGTAKLPSSVDVNVFEDAMFQWATTLTTSGQNLPFVLPQRVDRIGGGFSMEFLMSDDSTGAFEAIASIRTAVEDIEGGDGARAFIITGYGRIMDLVDTPVVMGSMPNAVARR